MAFALPLFLTAAGATGTAGAVTAGLTTAQTIGIGLTAASALAGVAANNSAAAYEGAIAKNNAAYADLQARDALDKGVAQSDANRYNMRKLIGTQRARYGASGVQLTSGSPLEVMADTLRQGELDEFTIRNNAAREAFGFNTQAWGERVKAKAIKSGRNWKNVGTLLTAGADAYGIYRNRKY